jgi:hypothetical protein
MSLTDPWEGLPGLAIGNWTSATWSWKKTFEMNQKK